MTTKTNSTFLTAQQVADRYSVGIATPWRWSRDQNNPFPEPVKLGANCTRWRLADLEQWETEREAA